MILAGLFRAKPNPAEPLYEAIVAAARQPWAYREAAVPDTIDGRFDLLVLHLSLVLERLGSDVQDFKQALIDRFTTDMDDNLRELGAGDLGVGKKVRRMAEALAGRYSAYEKARTLGTMEEALARNVYAGKAGQEVTRLAAYALSARVALSQQSVQDLMLGKLFFA